mgnify:CR=1 FL=1
MRDPIQLCPNRRTDKMATADGGGARMIRIVETATRAYDTSPKTERHPWAGLARASVNICSSRFSQNGGGRTIGQQANLGIGNLRRRRSANLADPLYR